MTGKSGRDQVHQYWHRNDRQQRKGQQCCDHHGSRFGGKRAGRCYAVFLEPFPEQRDKGGVEGAFSEKATEKIGELKATKNASATMPVPRALAMRISRTNPSRRLPIVQLPTVAIDRKRDMRKPYMVYRAKLWQELGLIRWLFRRGGFGFDGIVQGFQQRLPDGLQFSFVLDLHAEDIFHVEDVDNLLAKRRDLCRRDLQTQIG